MTDAVSTPAGKPTSSCASPAMDGTSRDGRARQSPASCRPCWRSCDRQNPVLTVNKRDPTLVFPVMSAGASIGIGSAACRDRAGDDVLRHRPSSANRSSRVVDRGGSRQVTVKSLDSPTPIDIDAGGLITALKPGTEIPSRVVAWRCADVGDLAPDDDRYAAQDRAHRDARAGCSCRSRPGCRTSCSRTAGETAALFTLH